MWKISRGRRRFTSTDWAWNCAWKRRCSPARDLKWIEVAPAGAETAINLYKTDAGDEDWGHYAGTVGKPQSITIQATELEALAEGLRGRGVVILREPVAEPWGHWMSIQDSEGNTLIITADALTMRDE